MQTFAGMKRDYDPNTVSLVDSVASFAANPGKIMLEQKTFSLLGIHYR